MAHEILERDVQFGIEQAWHGLTTVLETIRKEDIQEKFLYPIVKKPLFFEVEDEKIPTDSYAIVSEDDNLPIGKAVSESYQIITNLEIFEMVQKELSTTRNTLVSCGTVSDRSKGFLVYKIADDFISANRNVEPYLNFIWGHGGNIPLIARSSFLVTVCANTFAMNLGRKGRDFNLSVKHTKNASLKIDNMANAIDRYIGVAAEFQLAMDEMESREADSEKALKIFTGALGEKDTKLSTRTKNTINDRLVPLFLNGRGNRGKSIADVFNATTDYFTHESSGLNNRLSMKQFVSSEFGSGAENKSMFFDILSDSEETERVAMQGEKILALS